MDTLIKRVNPPAGRPASLVASIYVPTLASRPRRTTFHSSPALARDSGDQILQVLHDAEQLLKQAAGIRPASKERATYCISTQATPTYFLTISPEDQLLRAENARLVVCARHAEPQLALLTERVSSLQLELEVCFYDFVLVLALVSCVRDGLMQSLIRPCRRRATSSSNSNSNVNCCKCIRVRPSRQYLCRNRFLPPEPPRTQKEPLLAGVQQANGPRRQTPSATHRRRSFVAPTSFTAAMISARLSPTCGMLIRPQSSALL
eukprot:m.304676 g.304676  ORF g.304676 m.304676 type:complete len:262 (-) comp55273_c1_seq12:426-1211(-)